MKSMFSKYVKTKLVLILCAFFACAGINDSFAQTTPYGSGGGSTTHPVDTPDFDAFVIIRTNWGNNMEDVLLGLGFSDNGPCLELLPEEYELFMGIQIVVADPNLSAYPDVYAGIDMQIPSHVSPPTQSTFVVGPMEESELESFDADGVTLYRQTFYFSTSFDGHCPHEDNWLMSNSMALLKKNANGNYAPYGVKEYQALFPYELLGGMNKDGSDEIYTEAKELCCRQEEKIPEYRAIDQGSIQETPDLQQFTNVVLSVDGERQMNDEKQTHSIDEITLSPNPFHGQLTITYEARRDEKMKLELVGSDGHLLFSKVIIHDAEGVQSYALPVSSLPSGVYFCKIQNGEQFHVHKLLKM